MDVEFRDVEAGTVGQALRHLLDQYIPKQIDIDVCEYMVRIRLDDDHVIELDPCEPFYVDLIYEENDGHFEVAHPRAA